MIVKLGDSPLAVQQSRYFYEVTTALLSVEERQLGLITFTVTNHEGFNNQACCVYMHGRLSGRAAVDVYDGSNKTDYVIEHALKQAGLELSQP